RRRPERDSVPPARATPAAREPAEPQAVSPAAPGPLHPALRAARGYYLLRQFQVCADAVAAALEEHHGALLPGAQRLLGMALGRLQDARVAARALDIAVGQEERDDRLRARLLSAQLAAGRPTGETS